MIYVSSSSVKSKNIKSAVISLYKLGFSNIELSGGTDYYEGLEDDLLELKEKYKINFLCHNYFPPPKEHFVMNLSSLNDKIYFKTIEHLKKAIILSKELGADKYSFHAGFFIDPEIEYLGNVFEVELTLNKEESLKKFVSGFRELQKESTGTNLYIENNVLSKSNYIKNSNQNIFMLTCYKDFIELKKHIKFNLLLDLGHLKVSSNSLGLHFDDELNLMIKNTDYIHISDNDGYHDQNNALEKESKLMKLCRKFNLKNKTITLEIYNIKKIKKSYVIIEEMIL